MLGLGAELRNLNFISTKLDEREFAAGKGLALSCFRKNLVAMKWVG